MLALLVSVRLGLEHGINWSEHQDPRRRILWDDLSRAREKIFILGDSEFCSYYVHSEEETIWRQLERLSGEQVFSGALNGAGPGDFLSASRLLVQERKGKEGGSVILDIVPTRLLGFGPQQAVDDRNYDWSARLNTGAWDALEHKALTSLFMTRVEIRGMLRRRESYFNRGDDRFRVWDRDGDFAQQRFLKFLRVFSETRSPKSFSWVTDVQNTLRAGGFRLILVLTPLNTRLVEEYASPAEKEEIFHAFKTARENFVVFASREGMPLVDLTDTIPSASLVDLVHTNSLGDRSIAEAIAEQLR
jgi:hypothetical protein